MSTKEEKAPNFINDIVEADLAENKNDGRVVTRFPPEPNGYLHIGHAKAICVSFGVAEKFGGACNLRFDDTNPSKERTEFVDAIQEDIKWLGFDWTNLCFASNYFEQLYDWAVQLIKDGKAYVCSLSADEMREYRGTLTEPGKNSPYRDRSVEENLELFAKMRAGEFEEGAHLLRAKIDMASPNINLRDPAMYRIRKAHHHRTGDAWCIYPMYDWAHGQSDAIEGITHSLCSLEFTNHRPLYDWYLEALGLENPPKQYEFARLGLDHTVMSKRKLRQLVEEGHVAGWDDPRMPTLSGMRRRGYTARSIRNFCDMLGVAKRNSTVEMQQLEFSVREDLNKVADRRMAVLNPLKIVIENYPEGESEEVMAVNNPENPELGRRSVPFSREIYIEREDFREDPPKKFFRLGPGREVRLKYGYYVTCTDFIKDEDTGEVVELRCTYDPETKGGDSPDGRKVRGTLHWVSVPHAVELEVREYNRLFTDPNPDSPEEGGTFLDVLNPESLVVRKAWGEPGLKDEPVGKPLQFERKGYYCIDPDSSSDALVFNRTVPLRDSWAKIEKKQKKKK